MMKQKTDGERNGYHTIITISHEIERSAVTEHHMSADNPQDTPEKKLCGRYMCRPQIAGGSS